MTFPPTGQSQMGFSTAAVTKIAARCSSDVMLTPKAKYYAQTLALLIGLAPLLTGLTHWPDSLAWLLCPLTLLTVLAPLLSAWLSSPTCQALLLPVIISSPPLFALLSYLSCAPLLPAWVSLLTSDPLPPFRCLLGSTMLPARLQANWLYK
jgi:hypothetical protein